MSQVNASSLSLASSPTPGNNFIFSPIPGVLFTEYGMEVTPGLDLSFEDWRKAGESLANLQRRSYMIFMWGWGDWLNKGKQKYGEKYTQGMEDTGLRYRTLVNYSYVAGATPRYLRGIPGLTQRHYLVVAKIKDPHQKLRLLIDAAVNGWTATVDLPRQIESDNLTGPSSESESGSDQDTGPGPPPPTLEDEIYSLQQEIFALEKSVVKLVTHNGYLEDIIGRSIVVMREIEDLVESDVAAKVRVVVAILEAEPRSDVFGAIVAAVDRYKAGDMTALVEHMDLIVTSMED